MRHSWEKKTDYKKCLVILGKKKRQKSPFGKSRKKKRYRLHELFGKTGKKRKTRKAVWLSWKTKDHKSCWVNTEKKDRLQKVFGKPGERSQTRIGSVKFLKKIDGFSRLRSRASRNCGVSRSRNALVSVEI